MSAESILILSFLFYFLIVFILSSLNPVYIQIRKIYLFRCLFPSWKFYEDVCYLPILYYRTSEDGNNFGPWQLAIEKLERSWANFFINPQGNLIHAYNSLLQQVENDKEELLEKEKNNFIETASYLLVKNLVLQKLKKNQKLYFQFKITSTMQGRPDDAEDTLISIMHEA